MLAQDNVSLMLDWQEDNGHKYIFAYYTLILPLSKEEIMEISYD